MSMIPTTTGAARVLMDLVKNLLIVGIGVDRGHQPALDADRIVEHLRERGEAVGGAAGVRNDGVCGGQRRVVDAVDHGEIDFLRGRRDQHPLRSRVEMLLAAGAVGEEAGAFERDIDAISLVRQLGRIALGRHVDALAVDDQVVAIDLDRALERTVDRIALEQAGVGFRIGQVVDRDEFEIMVGALDDRARDIAPDAPETVDRNLGRHVRNSF
jgi:hypothetical protein